MTSDPVALVATGFAKSFGGTAALADAGLVLTKGTIHALLGGNGSGKSTLIKCIAGVYQADAGELTVHGQALAASAMTPARASALKLRFVHQDLGLFPQLSIAENVALLGGYPKGRLTQAVRWGRLHGRVADLLARYEIDARPHDLVATLRPSQRSMLAIARSLEDQVADECILLLDEPTATLAEHEATELLDALRLRADAGQTIVLVSHRFPEVQSIADDVTVFRDGRVAASDRMTKMPIERLVQSMTGLAAGWTATASPRLSGLTAPSPRPPAADRSEDGSAPTGTVVPRLRLYDVSGGAARGVSLSVADGEIIGIAGLGGSGRSSILRAVFGDLAVSGGTMTVDGRRYAPTKPVEAMRTGIAFVPEDRLGDAAFLDLSVRENMSVTVLKNFWRGLRLSSRVECAVSTDLIERFGIRTQSAETPIGSLSGGNQQKAILARWLQRRPRLLLLDEPTQGVDIVARTEIYAAVIEAAATGCSVLVASSDLDELLTLTSRIVVLRAGRISATLQTDQTSREEIAHIMMSQAAWSPPETERITRVN